MTTSNKMNDFMDFVTDKSFFHGTSTKFEKEMSDPTKYRADIAPNKPNDNGSGFYLTDYFPQAAEQSYRAARLHNVQEMTLDSSNNEPYENHEPLTVEMKFCPSALESKVKVKEILMKKSYDINLNDAVWYYNNRIGKKNPELIISNVHNLDKSYKIVLNGMADGKVGSIMQEAKDIRLSGTEQDVKDFLESELGNLNQLFKFKNLRENICKDITPYKGSQLSIHSNEITSEAIELVRIIRPSDYHEILVKHWVEK